MRGGSRATSMRLAVKRWIVAAMLVSGFVAVPVSRAQTPLESQENQENLPQVPVADPQSALSRIASSEHSPLYQDLDLLRRDGFAGAQEATVSLRVVDKSGRTPPDLRGADFALTVNGTPRSARLHSPNSKTTVLAPMVLLVFPPNQPIVHSIAVREATLYFSQQPEEILPWRVGLFDANGKMTPFTNGRSQLLANLDEVGHATEPLQYTSDAGLPRNFRWQGSWFTKVEDAIAMMERFEGPKVILAMNPLAESPYGLNDRILAHDGPADLVPVAQHIGAHIYIANVGGPEVLVPGGDAAHDQPAQVNTMGGPRLGSTPSQNMRIDPRQTAALNRFAYSNSLMMQTAADTLGGFSNSLKDLAAQIHRDLDGNYSMDFDLTPEDRDQGIPKVEVALARHDLKATVLDVAPVGSAVDNDRELVSKELMDTMRSATKEPVTSPDFRITQHIDFFPLRAGLEPVLPMTCIVEWTGPGHGPRQLSVVESVEDLTLSSVVLEREIHARWDGRSLSWERDGRLRPGHYVWRVVVHDGAGKVYSSAQEKLEIGFPHETAVGVSSLILGKLCQQAVQPDSGLRRRVALNAKAGAAADDGRMQIDPMHAGDCRLQPEATGRFATTDLLHAFVRIYPSEKFGKHKADSWTAKFVLRSQSGAVEAQKELAFTVDSGSGYLASVQMPLDDGGISAGPHTLDVEMHGPGMRAEQKQSRSISIEARTR